MKRKSIIISLGCLFIATGLLSAFYIKWNDTISGALMGAGIGMLLFMIANKKTQPN